MTINTINLVPIVGLAIILTLSTGCAAKRYTWDCPGGACDQTKFQSEDAECQRKANELYVPWVAGQSPRQTIYKDCMEGRGYVKVGSESVPQPKRWHMMPEPIKQDSLPALSNWTGITMTVTDPRRPPQALALAGADAPSWEFYSKTLVQQTHMALLKAVGPGPSGDMELRVRIMEHVVTFESGWWLGTTALDVALFQRGRPTGQHWTARGQDSRGNWFGMATGRSALQTAFETAVRDLLRQLAQDAPAHAILEPQSSPVAQASQQNLPIAQPANPPAVEPASTALEEHMAQLDDLRAKRIITDDEHALMRRRLLENAGPADLIAAGRTAREPISQGSPISALASESSWFTGVWAAEAPGNPRLQITARSGGGVDWEYRVQVGGTLTAARGTGTVNGTLISMTGAFVEGGQQVLAKRLVFELSRDGETLAGTGTGAREVPFTIRFTRAR